MMAFAPALLESLTAETGQCPEVDVLFTSISPLSDDDDWVPLRMAAAV
jgi:hypothetical protein